MVSVWCGSDFGICMTYFLFSGFISSELQQIILLTVFSLSAFLLFPLSLVTHFALFIFCIVPVKQQ